jgi:hypothetical protein
MDGRKERGEWKRGGGGLTEEIREGNSVSDESLFAGWAILNCCIDPRHPRIDHSSRQHVGG